MRRIWFPDRFDNETSEEVACRLRASVGQDDLEFFHGADVTVRERVACLRVAHRWPEELRPDASRPFPRSQRWLVHSLGANQASLFVWQTDPEHRVSLAKCVARDAVAQLIPFEAASAWGGVSRITVE